MYFVLLLLVFFSFSYIDNSFMCVFHIGTTVVFFGQEI